MTTLQTHVEEALADAARRQAAAQGKTLEEWLAEVVAQQVQVRDQRVWAREFLAATEHPKGDSRGWKWNRAELYDE